MQRVALAVAMVMTLGSGYLAGVAASTALAAPVRPAERATVAPDPSGKVYRGGILPAITVVVRPLPFSAASGGTACRQTRST